jgi:2-oxoglutarate ferredoxin oxidoreductase subunit delta
MKDDPKVEIQRERCKKCYICVEFCPRGAIRGGEDGFPVVDEEKCNQCGLCEMYCPDFAIQVKPKKEKAAHRNEI